MLLLSFFLSYCDGKNDHLINDNKSHPEDWLTVLWKHYQAWLYSVGLYPFVCIWVPCVSSVSFCLHIWVPGKHWIPEGNCSVEESESHTGTWVSGSYFYMWLQAEILVGLWDIKTSFPTSLTITAHNLARPGFPSSGVCSLSLGNLQIDGTCHNIQYNFV